MTAAVPTIAAAAKQIAAKQLSPVELTKACLDRVHALDDRLHAFVHLTEERALAEARAAEAAGVRGKAVTPYLLAHMQRVTGGASVAVNLDVARGNIALAAQVAVAWSARE